eukprot:2168659-Amphidinium_carterae.1
MLHAYCACGRCAWLQGGLDSKRARVGWMLVLLRRCCCEARWGPAEQCRCCRTAGAELEFGRHV